MGEVGKKKRKYDVRNIFGGVYILSTAGDALRDII
jgi:hypothetical protein